MNQKFTHLHVHSHYSLLDGLPKIDQLLDYVKDLGMDSVALTDHGALYGAVEFYQKARERKIKPILGCEVYLAHEGMRQKRPNIDDKRSHMILLVKNEEGYKNLVKLITKANLEGFYYKPRVDIDLLQELSAGLICLSGCLQGKIPKLILAKKIKEAEDLSLKYQEIFGKDNFYFELQRHPNIPVQKIVNETLVSLSKKLKIPIVATHDIHYLKPEDAEAQDILMLINTGADRDDPERLTMESDDFSMKSTEDMIDIFKDLPEAIENTQKIANVCNFDFQLGKTTLPHFELPSGKTADGYLKELCYQGIEKRKIKTKKEVIDRLEYELSVIKNAGFASYFLIIQDLVNWAKEKRIIVGPGRGSVAGSLAAYLLNITNVDPLKYNLLFERFLTEGRISFPDIDLDFTDIRRDEVIDYVTQKYGRGKVAQIITFGTMAARAVIRDVGRAQGHNYGFCDQIAKMIPFQFTLDETLEKVKEFRLLYEQDAKAKELIDFSRKLEGVARHASTHACGVVISSENLENIVPLQRPTQDDDAIVTQYEMGAIEKLGLLKMDFLGLKNLTIIEDTLTRIYKVQDVKLDIENISLNDKKVYKLLQNGDTTGVFQLECLSGETIISNTTIKKLCEERNKTVLQSVYLDEGRIHKNQILNVLPSGKKEVYTLITENNWYIKSTKDHYFLTENGWKKLEDIRTGDKILIKTKAKHLVDNTCKICGKQISGQEEGKSKFCYRCSASFYKNPSKKESRKKISQARIRFYKDGGKPWNYGITTENNPLWKETAKKISKALAGRTYEEIYGKKRAEKLKKVLSERMIGKNNFMFGKPAPHRKGGFRGDLGHYVRSTWEADFARILKLHNLDYEYEPRTFRLIKPNKEIIHYTPDFYVKYHNAFYEIKGWFHDLDREKIKLFQEQYPQHKLVLISATKFAEFALKYKTLINWECPRMPIKQSFKFIVVKKIKYSGRENTYDIAMQSPGNNFVANGFLVHNSSGMKRYLKELKPTEFEDIIAMIALYRPGPMELIPDYIQRKHKKKKVEYLHPSLKPILESTYGICIFQEQLMQIGQKLAGFSLVEADVLRKAVGKKIKPLLVAQKEKMMKGMEKNGIEKEVARRIWEWILPFARYGFNKSHSTAYATIAYQTAYLKANYPIEFMAALLTSEKTDVERIGFLIGECQKMAIKILPPDVNESFRNFSVIPKEKKIRFGLLAIKNVGHNVVEAVVQERKKKGPFQSIFDFISRIESKNLNKKSLESLIKAGCFDKFEERNKLLSNVEKLLEWNKNSQRIKIQGQKSLFGEKDGFKMNSNFALGDIKPAAKTEKLNWEKELLGLYVTSHPLEDFKGVFAKKVWPISKISTDLSQRIIKIGGVISNVKKIVTRTGRPMLFLSLEDLTDRIEVVAFPGIVERNPTIFQENKIVMISGRVDNREGTPKIICEEIEEIIENS